MTADTLPEYPLCRIAAQEHPTPEDLPNLPWDRAGVITPFILADGSGPAGQSTEARILADDRHLFFRFECADPCVWGTMTRDNDPIFDEEVVEVFLDPDPSDDLYWEFELSPNNVRFAALIRNPGPPENEKILRRLDCSRMITRAEIYPETWRPEGWRAYLALPFALMETAPARGGVWRMNLYRIDRPHPTLPCEVVTDEFSCWSPTLTSPAAFHRPARFGFLRFSL